MPAKARLERDMKLELAIYVTTFALVGMSYLLSGKKEFRDAAVQELEHTAQLDALMRPLLLFTLKTPVAHC
jgi:hypothetical protein